MQLKGTLSEEHVHSAFVGESCARCAYAYYAECARDAGEEDIAVLYERMAEMEKAHATLWFQLLNPEMGGVRECLERVIGNERCEAQELYPAYARQAREDNLEALALLFEKVAAIEADHQKQFQEALIEYMSLEDAGAGAQAEAVPSQSAAAPEGGYRCVLCGNRLPAPADVCPVCGAQACYEPVQNQTPVAV